MKKLNIVIPMAGAGSRFAEAGYSFPKPLIDVNGKPMIQLVIENLTPKVPHKFIFICQQEHYDKYSLDQIFRNLTTEHEVIKLNSATQGAACTVLLGADYIDNDDELVIANSDQLIDVKLDNFINYGRKSGIDGLIMTFQASHPKWSYARIDKKGNVIETAEKKVISNNATVGIYYFKVGKDFVAGASSMIEKNIRFNNEFYVCPVYNELILRDKRIKLWEIKQSQMHGLGTPEDLENYLLWISKKRKRSK